MTLSGWSGPISKALEQAIKEGKVIIIYSEKDKYDYLRGSYVEHGIIREFQ